MCRPKKRTLWAKEITKLSEIADQFEREANNFARFALFKGETYARYAG